MDRENFINRVLEVEPVLYRISRGMLLNLTDCEDAVQNTILKAYEKLNTLKEERFFKTWLIRILINECYTFKRKREFNISYEDYFESGEKDIPSPTPVDYNPLYNAIYSLKPKIKAVIVLHYIEEYSIEEIKEILKIPAGTVKSRLHKGRAELKTILNSMEVNYGKV